MLLSLLCLGFAASAPKPPVAGGKADCRIFVLRDCPIANQFAPEVQRIIKAYAPKGIRFTLVYADSDMNTKDALKHAKEFGYSVPVVSDATHELAKKHGVSVSPSAVLYKANTLYYKGRINDLYPSIGQRRPQPTTHDLRDALDSFLAGKPVKVPTTEAVGCRLY